MSIPPVLVDEAAYRGGLGLTFHRTARQIGVNARGALAAFDSQQTWSNP